MFDFRLKVFYTAAKRLNFTRASEELYITQPAVSKHIHEIEVFYKTKLFERNGAKVKLTSAGAILLKHTEHLIRIYDHINEDLAILNKEIKGTLKIGASTTVAHYFLPRYLASFKQKYPEVKISFYVHNTEHIENLLLENKIDIGVVEGQSKRPSLKYACLITDEIVLCTRNQNPMLKKGTLSTADLRKLPLVIRERGSGSLEVILSSLKNIGVEFTELNIDMELENTEGIKCYLLNSDSYAFLSVHSIRDLLHSGQLQVVDIKGLYIQRCFHYTTQQGDNHYLQEIFYKHLTAQQLK